MLQDCTNKLLSKSKVCYNVLIAIGMFLWNRLKIYIYMCVFCVTLLHFNPKYLIICTPIFKGVMTDQVKLTFSAKLLRFLGLGTENYLGC